MPTVPEKSRRSNPDPVPSILRSVGFGLMLAVWWILSIELPRLNLYRIENNRVLHLQFNPISTWVYGVANLWSDHRFLGIMAVLVLTFLHIFLWKRRGRWDDFGKWLFKAGFMVSYILLYGFFLLMFIGAEWPIYDNPARSAP